MPISVSSFVPTPKRALRQGFAVAAPDTTHQVGNGARIRLLMGLVIIMGLTAGYELGMKYMIKNWVYPDEGNREPDKGNDEGNDGGKG